MKTLLPTFLLAASASLALAGDYPRTIFSDDFSADGFGKRWGHYKSGSVVKEGKLIGITPDGSDHAAVDNIKFDGERDLEVQVKFRFVSDKAKSFNVWFDDKDYKGSHAGHICNVTVSTKDVAISDAKTGLFRNDYNAKRKSPEGLSAEDKEFLRTKTKRVPNAVSLNDWHVLNIQTKGDEISVTIDGKAIGSFKSEGVSHDTKSLVSLTTNPIDIEYDDFSIKGVAK